MVPDPEALSILARAHARRDPTAHQQGRVQAGIDLQNAVELAAKTAGYSARRGFGPDRRPAWVGWRWVECVWITHKHHGHVAVFVSGDRFVLRAHTPHAWSQLLRLPPEEGQNADANAFPPTVEIDAFDIEYDPLTRSYVGTREDGLLVPVPGEVRRRRSAVAVVAERIVQLFDEQSRAMHPGG